MMPITRILALFLAVLLARNHAFAQDAPRTKKEFTMHTVFSAECTNYFDWQSIGLVRSHREVGMPGPITRLLACSEDRLKTYKYLNIVPTHVHPNYGDLHMADLGDSYVPYNKPGSIKHWLENTNVTEDFVFFIDADMLFLKAVTPELVNAVPGHAVSAAYDYLIGVDDPLVAPKFLEEQYRPLMRKVGGWVMMYTDDMRKVAPFWLKYTEDVRTSPLGLEVWTRMGDSYVTKEFPRPWISEMYGYVFGAARAGVDHTVNRNMMLYPTYVPEEPPYILHYGLEVKIGRTYVYDKHHHTSADMLACPVKYFKEPPTVEAALKEMFPDGAQIPPKEEDRLKLAIFTVTALNAALNKHSEDYCPVCPPDCIDTHEMCGTWKDAGECTKNPGFMEKSCKASCGVCTCGEAVHSLDEPTRLTGVAQHMLRGGSNAVPSVRDTSDTILSGGSRPDTEALSSPPPPLPVMVNVAEEGAIAGGVQSAGEAAEEAEGVGSKGHKHKGHRAKGMSLWSHYIRGALQFCATAAFFGLLSEMHRRRGIRLKKAAKAAKAASQKGAEKSEKKESNQQQQKPHQGADEDDASDEDW